MEAGLLADVEDAANTLLATLRTASATANDDQRAALLRISEGVGRQLTVFGVHAVGQLSRDGFFAEHGYRSVTQALSDQLGLERFEARQRVTAVEHVCPRTTLDGGVLAPKLPATAPVFDAGQATVRHVEKIAKVLGSSAASRITPQQWAGVEEELADKAPVMTPTELFDHGTALVNLLDQDGPEPDDRDPVDDLQIRRHRDGSGGTITGRFTSAGMFGAISQLIDAQSKPLGKEDLRGLGQRQAEALGDICGYVLDHGDVPERGGQRPQLNVLIGLEDLEHRARNATLDFGGLLSPSEARMLACDCSIIPTVLGANSEPLDIGRSSRVISEAIRRALIVRDRGCAWPGCDKPPSWCGGHHIIYWFNGGNTSLDNCVLLCKAHHRLLHASEWTIRMRDGWPEFIPPEWIDPTRTPRRRSTGFRPPDR